MAAQRRRRLRICRNAKAGWARSLGLGHGSRCSLGLEFVDPQPSNSRKCPANSGGRIGSAWGRKGPRAGKCPGAHFFAESSNQMTIKLHIADDAIAARLPRYAVY